MMHVSVDLMYESINSLFGATHVLSKWVIRRRCSMHSISTSIVLVVKTPMQMVLSYSIVLATTSMEVVASTILC